MNYTKALWQNQKDLTLDQWNICRILGNLDDIATDYETRWGKGKLQELAPPDLRAKWDRQQEKLAEAVDSHHADNVLTLALGTRKAWEMLEESALSLGHAPLDPNAWEVLASDGTLYQVFSTKGKSHGENGISVQELVKFYHNARMEAIKPPPPKKEAKDYKVGEVAEELPF